MLDFSELSKALSELNESRVYSLVEEKLANNEDPLTIIKECNNGMIKIGKLFSDQIYFISELIFSAEIFKNVMERISPLLEGGERVDQTGDLVVIGTVKGDIHDIGKNIVVNLLKGSGFNVVDLGVDVPAEVFVKSIQETGAKVVGLSALLNLAFGEMKNVVDSISTAGLKDQVRIMIGGAPCNETVREFCGADYYAKDASEGVFICKRIYDWPNGLVRTKQ